MNRKAFNEEKQRMVGKNDVCFTITADGIGATRRYKLHRSNGDIDKFTIDELKIICGFPTDFILTGAYSRQWERLGRAVPPLMMKAIAEHIYETILKPLKN